MKRFSFFLAFTLLIFAQPVQATNHTAAPTPATPAAPASAPATPATSRSGSEVQTFRPPTDFGYQSPVGNASPVDIIQRFITFMLGIVGALLLTMFVYAGGLWMMAQEDMKKVQTAKDTLKNAIIGMLIVVLSYALVTSVFTLGNQLRDQVTEETDTDTEYDFTCEELDLNHNGDCGADDASTTVPAGATGEPTTSDFGCDEFDAPGTCTSGGTQPPAPAPSPTP